MLRGLYEFRPINEKTLGFQMNDLLLFLEPHARDKNWLRVADSNGHIGFVPINFIEIHRETTSDKLLSFLDEAMRRAKRDRLQTVELLGSVRQNIITSRYSMEEQMGQIEREVIELRARAISELSYEEDYQRRSSGGYKPKEKHSSPRQGTYSSSLMEGIGVSNRSPGQPHSNRHLHHHHHHHQPSSALPSSQSHLIRESSAPNFYPHHHHHHSHFHETEPELMGSGSGGNAVGPRVGLLHGQDHGLNDPIILPGLPLLPSSETSSYVMLQPPIGVSILEQQQQNKKCRSKKHKKSSETGKICGSATHYAEITVLPSGSVPLPNPDVSRIVGKKEDAQEEESSLPKGCPPPPPAMIMIKGEEGNCGVGRRCSQTHCQRQSEHNCCCSPSKECGALRKFQIPGSPLDTVTMAAELVDIVRNATGLSHKLSQDASEVVLQYVTENISGMPEELTKLLSHLEHPRAISLTPSVISRSPDAYNIRKIFHRLTQAKDDEQQRSWALYEDEGMIHDNLDHLHGILSNADASISKYVMESEGYNSVNALVLYYQMETRWSIRAKLIDCFGAMCNIDVQALSILLNSILPMELAREIRESQGNAHRISLCAGLLVVLLSTGENIPITHFDHLGKEFLEFVFQIVENPPDQDEKITDVFMNLLFAYNLQFKCLDDNLIISTLEERSNANVFTQKVIHFLNREVDPIDILDHPRDCPNSVFKLTTDVFSSKKAADLFYTNDIKVLIDIVTRCVTDLGPGEKRRTSYLKLIQVIIRNSNFSEHKHRLEDLQNCFMSILMDSEPLAILDQKLIRDMIQEFDTFFKIN